MLEVLITPDEPGCSAAVGSEGKVVWQGARGMSDLKSGAKITPETVFDIGSVTKQFTATAILLLADSGKLRLDDKVSTHVNRLPSWSNQVTLKQLLHHTSGIPEYLKLLYDRGHRDSDRTTRKQALSTLTSVRKLNFKPGSEWEYSNSNYLLLGEVVQEVSGEPLPSYLRRMVFQPLKLDMVMDPSKSIPQKAVPYTPQGSSFAVSRSPYEQVGDAGIQTTPTELVRWADNYRTGRVGGAQWLSAVMAEAVAATALGNGMRYGAGIVESGDGSLGHGGGVPGFSTDFMVSPDRRVAVAVSCNRSQIDVPAMRESLSTIWSTT